MRARPPAVEKADAQAEPVPRFGVQVVLDDGFQKPADGFGQIGVGQQPGGGGQGFVDAQPAREEDGWQAEDADSAAMGGLDGGGESADGCGAILGGEEGEQAGP